MVCPINDGVLLWQKDAQCAGMDTNVFFDEERAAKKLCDSCPVKAECLEYALLYNMSGVWGGTTDKDRRRIPKRNIEFLRDDYIESGLYNTTLKV